MVSIRAVGITNAKIVDDETENNVTCGVFSKARCQLARFVAVGLEKGDELIVGKASGLWQAVHAASYFDVDVSVVKEWCEVVLFNDGLRQHPDGHSHVFVTGHWCAEVEVF